MQLPAAVTGREVIFGGGLHAAVYAATRVACGYPKPVVLEKEKTTGGIFARLANFRLNSANGASVASVATPGPTRVMPMSPSDDLNWLPNAPIQVRDMSGMVEYPYSFDMRDAIQKTLSEYAEVYTDANFTFNLSGTVSVPNDGRTLGTAKRILFAGGLVVPDRLPKGAAIMSGYDFLRRPVRDLGGKKIALVGGGDTAAQIAEFMLGQGLGGAPTTPPSNIHWYGGESMPLTKDQWMGIYHARFAGIGRHLPQAGVSTGVIRPIAARGDTLPLGSAAMVNGQVFDLVILATGFAPAPCPVPTPNAYAVGGTTVARYSNTTSGGRDKILRR